MLKRLIFHCIILLTLINHSSCAQDRSNNKPTKSPKTSNQKNDNRINDEFTDNFFVLKKGLDFTVKLLPERTNKKRPLSPVHDNLNQPEQALPPVREYKVRLHIKNRQSFPMWYIIPTYGETTLPKEGHFETAAHQLNEAFSGKIYEGYVGEDSVGKVVELTFNGSYQSAFKAFYLPPGASVTFRNYVISSWEELNSFELWGAKHLLVNGEQPLQQWIPYQLLSDGNLIVHCAANEPCAFRDIGSGVRSNTAKDKVNFVQAKTFKKHTITLK
ncbi:MAG: hypothetical protein MK212_09950 [Saprospiraceae bacterium]|nr:hypothetical protein [Saprospiraceae bacterium]